MLQLFGFAFPPGSDIGFTGGEAAVYRLHLAVTNRAPQSCPTLNEREPNNTGEQAGQIDLPASITGTIHEAGDEDRFRFAANRGDTIECRVEAATFGSPLDAWLALENSAGSQLARADDAADSRDPRLEWKAPTNGNFIVAVGSVTHRGGPEFCYRLSVRTAPPDYRATLAASALLLTGGSTNELKLDLKRLRGFTNDLSIAFRDLPEGVTALTTNLPRKDGEVSIQLLAKPDAPKFQGPVRLLVTDSTTRDERPAPVELTTRGETGWNQLLIETTEQLWLTVRPQAADTEKLKGKQ